MTTKAPLRVHQTTTTAGTGSYSLDVATGQFRNFRAAYVTGAKVPYVATDNLNNFEIGYGTLTIGTPDVVSRDTIVLSSNGGNAVNWVNATVRDIFAWEGADSEYAIGFAGNKVLASGSDEWSNLQIYTGAGGNILTLPAFASVPLGWSFPVLNGGTGNLALAAAGTDTWQIGGAPTIAPQQQVSVKKGLTGWAVLGRIAGIVDITGGTITGTTISNSPISGSTGSFTTLIASAAVTLSPASANVVLSPTGTGIVTINPATAGSMNNVVIGGSLAVAGSFTALNSTSGALNGTLGAITPATATMTTLTANVVNGTNFVGDTFAGTNFTGGTLVGSIATLSSKVRTPLIDTATGNLVFMPATGLTSTQVGAATLSIIEARQTGTGNAAFSWFLDGANSLKATANRSAAQLQFTSANPFNFGAFDYSNGNVSWGGFPGSESFRAVPVASAVTRIEARGGATGVPASFFATGETNTGQDFFTSGTSGYRFFTNGAFPQFLINHTASANCFLTVTGGNATDPILSVGGITNLGLTLSSQGTGSVSLLAGTNVLARFLYGGVVANYVNFQPSAGAPIVGTSANDLKLAPATGIVQFGTYTAGVVVSTGTVQIRDSTGTLRTLLCA